MCIRDSRIPVDLILFADTGAEHPHTYAYLDIMDRWLKDHGMPPITRVYKTCLLYTSLSDKYDLTKHPDYKYTADADKKYLFDMERYMKRRPAIVKPDEPFEMYELTAADLQ